MSHLHCKTIIIKKSNMPEIGLNEGIYYYYFILGLNATKGYFCAIYPIILVICSHLAQPRYFHRGGTEISTSIQH